MSEPSTDLLRYRPMVDWLKTKGIPESETKKLIAVGTIKQGFLRKPDKKKKQKRVWAWYSPKQIRRDVLKDGENESGKQETRK